MMNEERDLYCISKLNQLSMYLDEELHKLHQSLDGEIYDVYKHAVHTEQNLLMDVIKDIKYYKRKHI